MASIPHYDYLVIGGGSGGVASARRAASYGAKTLLIEGKALGGTCVNVGCVPKKVMWNASDLAGRIRQAKEYGFPDVDPKYADNFDWSGFKAKRDAYVKRLNGIYERNLQKEGVEYVFGWATLYKQEGQEFPLVHVKSDDGNTKLYSAKKIMIATGGKPRLPDVPGAEYGIDSDGFFALETQPKRVAVVGGGYIGVELAGVFHGLNSETTLFCRGQTVLRAFDIMIQDTITDYYVKEGINVLKGSGVKKIVKKDNGELLVTYEQDGAEKDITLDSLIWTIGREPLKDTLNLGEFGIKTNKRGYIEVDEYQRSSVDNIYSLGDVCGKVELTPMAIAAGRKLSNRLFGPTEFKNQKQDYTDVPSAVFSHPEVGSIGITEAAAKEQYGEENVKVYTSKFVAMYYAMLEEKAPTAYKLVCAGKDEKVVGLHIVGADSAEILQGFGVAIRMGATKADFDNVVAIHPTSAEELVTMR
ncbi:glutathione reductase [Yarrowia lipolytica]|uniref:Glutathione reductase n=2 Tax=Yarrowia lipolytica TaxID=4952 RepID=GSHR_YARLI|nr:YALI0E18029p [Yarrowia lipolytica CLIB122]Q6C5H4.1 RecName: Full=Glutathione reductase; Short=GR; Short=GRase [Yarrowia lipolytica CLIB122]RDW23694.1 glutathione reductase [Yarrowia lipolytica]RDW33251.1 glutathione reductase [Yarrowia lipolytica]RDW38696.1 glutathione reductase [Yarrowia lipolytica]RDW47059.1 glutathione reductase [Yarrowia lipolytica]RDW49996.1 glutathione reductase [Yarrowia lipolytica]|eukprot:XP_504088.1 YALI0E18029p [Yarrowia lipolytica CLIB122]